MRLAVKPPNPPKKQSWDQPNQKKTTSTSTSLGLSQFPHQPSPRCNSLGTSGCPLGCLNQLKGPICWCKLPTTKIAPWFKMVVGRQLVFWEGICSGAIGYLGFRKGTIHLATTTWHHREKNGSSLFRDVDHRDCPSTNHSHQCVSSSRTINLRQKTSQCIGFWPDTFWDTLSCLNH